MAADLQIAVEEAERWSRRLSITVPAERVQRTRSSVAARIAQSARLPGFRKGKLPARVIEQRFGPAIEQETVDRLIQEAYREALDEQGLVPVSRGIIDKIEYEAGTDLSFQVEFDVRPEIQLDRLGGFTVQRQPTEVGEDEVDSVLDRLREDRGVWRPLPSEADLDFGDQVTVEITPLAEAEEEASPARSYRFVLGDGNAMPAVEEAIRTLHPGEEKEFEVPLPAPPQPTDEEPSQEQAEPPESATQIREQRLRIHVVEGERKELPPLDDEFARSVGDFEGVTELRERILTDLRADTERRADNEVQSRLLDQIIEANRFDVPDSMVERYLEHLLPSRPREGAKEQTLTPEEEGRFAKLRTDFRPQAEWNLKRMLIVERITEQEGLRATQDEIDARVEELAEEHDRSPSEVWIQLEKSGQLESLEREITEDKVFEFLKSQSTVQQQ